MNIRKLALLAAVAATLSPAISDAASPEKAALNACARAFASSLAAPGAAAPAFKVVYGGERYGESTVNFFARSFTFELHAADLKTGSPIARASCSTNPHGDVVALSSIPLDAVRPTLTLQN